MKSLLTICIAMLLVCSQTFAQGPSRGGIIYGPKSAFKIDAPKGWVLDNSAGIDQGLPCVLYPKGSSWADAKTIVYAKIASADFTEVDAFVAKAIKEMKKTHGTPKEKIESGKTGDGKPYFVNEYRATESHSQWERIAYVQLPGAVAYIVLSSRDEPSYRKDSGALTEILKSFAYMSIGKP
ncbi:MAG: hypothetical protein ABI925_02510 [Verrucomicrobiota bacterium]